MDEAPPETPPVPHGSPLSICLFCGSSNAADPEFLAGASAFGRQLADEGVRLVYGGGGIGLMGAAAKAAHQAGGSVLGIIPEFLRRKEVIYDEVDTIVVDNMHERKMLMYREADAIAVFPGGVGTLEEVIELISWRRLALHNKPIVFADLKGFWQPFFELIDHTVEARVTPRWLPATWASVPRAEDVLPRIRQQLAARPELPDRVPPLS